MRSFILTPLFLAALASAGAESSSAPVPTEAPSWWGAWGIQGCLDEKCESVGDKGWSGSEPQDCTSLKDNIKSLGSRGFHNSDFKLTAFKDDHCGGDSKEIDTEKCSTSKTLGFKPKSFKVDKK